jgi:hypothetical protein
VSTPLTAHSFQRLAAARRRRSSGPIALGFVPDDRFVLVVFQYDEATCWVRVVTAYEPTSNRWWKIYAKAKGIED